MTSISSTQPRGGRHLRRTFPVPSIAGMFLALFAAQMSAATPAVTSASPEHGAPQIVTHRINDRLLVLLGGGGQGAHVGVLRTATGPVLIDTMLEATQESLRTALEEVDQLPVRAVIHTHDHPDHTGGSADFARRGATLFARESAEFDPGIEWFGVAGTAGWQLHDEVIQLYPVESHSPSDLLVFLPRSNVLFLGDTFTNSWYPAFFQGGLSGQLEALDLALELSDDQTVVVPGHGFLSDRAGVLRYRDACVRWVERILELHAAGRTPEQMADDEALRAIRLQFHPKGEGDERFERFFPRLITNALRVELERLGGKPVD